MNDFILKLRNFSLRWAVALFLVATVVLSIYQVKSGPGMGFVTIVSGLLMAILYIMIAVQSIERNEKALTVSYILLLACVIAIINGFVNYKDSPDFGNPDVMELAFGNNYYEEWIVGSFIKSAPYSLATNIVFIAAFGYGLPFVRKRLVFSWILFLVAFAITTYGLSQVVSWGALYYNSYISLSWVSSGISFIALVSLLILIGKQDNPKVNRNKVKTQQVQEINNTSQTAKPLSMSEQLFKLKELLDSGILTQEEFDTEKKKILNS